MKTKKMAKRFVLNKATIANLNRDEMAAVQGGDDTCNVSCACFSDTTQNPACEITRTHPKASYGGTC